MSEKCAVPHFKCVLTYFKQTHRLFSVTYLSLNQALTHLRESLGFPLEMIAKDFHAIPALIEPRWIIGLSVHRDGVCAKSGGNMAVDFPGVGSFRIEFGPILRTLDSLTLTTFPSPSSTSILNSSDLRQGSPH